MVDSHGQQLSNEDLEEMAKELSPEEEEKEKDEERLLKCMKTSNLQHILSATGTLNDEICDNGHSWEWNAKVKRSIMVSIGTYSETLKERKGKSWQSMLHAFFPKRGRSSTRDFIREVRSLKNAMVKTINATVLQWHLQKVFIWASNITKYVNKIKLLYFNKHSLVIL